MLQIAPQLSDEARAMDVSNVIDLAFIFLSAVAVCIIV